MSNQLARNTSGGEFRFLLEWSDLEVFEMKCPGAFVPCCDVPSELSGASEDLINRLIPDHIKRQMGLHLFASHGGMT